MNKFHDSLRYCSLACCNQLWLKKKHNHNTKVLSDILFTGNPTFHNCHLGRSSIRYIGMSLRLTEQSNIGISLQSHCWCMSTSSSSDSFETIGIQSGRLGPYTLLLSSFFCSVTLTHSLFLNPSLPPRPHDTSETTVWICGCR